MDSLAPFIIWSLVATLALYLAWRVALPRLLAWRGITLRQTRFGITLVFDAADDDGTPVRLLNVNGVFQSAGYLEPGLVNELVCEYHRRFAQVVEAMPRLSRAAVIGGGGYSFPKWLLAHAAPARIDVVEIDPQITQVAREFFGLDRAEAAHGTGGDDRLHEYAEDGWAWLRAQHESIDLVVNDAFSGKRPLGPLATGEGARLVRGHLCADGVYLANVRASLEGRHAAALRDVAEAFSREFAHVWIVPEHPDDPGRLGYNALVATDLADVAPAGALAWQGVGWAPWQ